jgi:predicted Zn-ribbon and HTH transcriptional regulator
MSDTKAKLLEWARRNKVEAAAVAKRALVFLAPPPEVKHCARCGYKPSVNTVLIPAGRCPSCGALLVARP